MTSTQVLGAVDPTDPDAEVAHRTAQRLRQHAEHLVGMAEQMLAQAEAELAAALQIVTRADAGRVARTEPG